MRKVQSLVGMAADLIARFRARRDVLRSIGAILVNCQQLTGGSLPPEVWFYVAGGEVFGEARLSSDHPRVHEFDPPHSGNMPASQIQTKPPPSPPCILAFIRAPRSTLAHLAGQSFLDP